MSTDILDPINESLRRIIENSQKSSPSEDEDAIRREIEATEKEREEQQRNQFRKTLWDGSGVPRRHQTFELPSEGPWREAYDRLAGALGTGFIFVAMGPRGTGKTQLGTAIIKQACRQLLRAKYVKALDIFISLRESFRKEGDTERAAVKRFTEPDLLVIDAMEERGETDFEDRLLNHIIDKRYDNLSDTLLITNQTAEAFAKSAGPSIVSRIHETGGSIKCEWPSFRSAHRIAA